MKRGEIREIFKKLDGAFLPIGIKEEDSLEQLILSRASLHLKNVAQETQYSKILFFLLGAVDEKGEFFSSLSKCANILYPRESEKESVRDVLMALNYFRMMKLFRLEWTDKESFKIDASETVKTFTSSGMGVFKKLSEAFLPMDRKFQDKLHSLIFKCLRFQQVGLIEWLRIFSHIVALADEENQVVVKEETLFEALARPDKKETMVPGRYTILSFLKEMQKKKAFSINWSKDGGPHRINMSEVFIFLEGGWETVIKPVSYD